MADELEYRVVHHAGVDTLHRHPAFEQCNLDDAEDLEKVDEMTAAALLAGGHASACQHCRPEPVG